MIKICKEKNPAQISTRKSPFDREKLSEVIQSIYNPMVASTTPSHTFTPTFFFIKRPKIGTIKIYIAVINPAFPTVVKEIPNC